MKSIQFNSNIENLNLVEKLVNDLLAQYDLPSDLYGKLLLALTECVNNAIVHGNQLDESKKVVIDYVVTETILEVTVKDQGEGFDYDNVEDPTLPENLEKLSGRGIFLMRQLADKVEFEKNGAIVKLYFNI